MSLFPAAAALTRWTAGLVLTLAVVFAIGAIGWRINENAWQARWSARDASDANDRADAERAARDAEQAENRKYEKVQIDATQALEASRTEVASLSAAADRLRQQVQQLLAAGRARTAPGTAANSPAGPDSGGVLAVVLEKSVERNRRLAEIADHARIGWEACAKMGESAE